MVYSRPKDSGEFWPFLLRHEGAPHHYFPVSQYLPGDPPTDLAARVQASEVTLRRSLNQVEVVCDLVRSVNAGSTAPMVADAVVAWAAEWLPPAAGWCVVGPTRTGTLAVVSQRGVESDAEPAAIGLGASVIEHSDICASRNLLEDSTASGAPAVAAMGFPLVSRGQTVAALVAVDREPSREMPQLSDGLRENVLEVLQAGAVALDSAQRLARAEELSVTDDLTGLYNLRYLRQALRREDKRRVRSRQPLSCVFADVDDFKRVNDQRGHLVGSRVLVEVAQIIRECSRETDTAARFGGDEFALVLPDTGTKGAMAVAARCVERVRGHVFLEEEGVSARLTLSAGVATMPDTTSKAEQLIQAADVAMYAVKTNGKDGTKLASVGPRQGVSA